MSSCVWPCVVSLRFDPFLSFECLYFLSILFISSVLLIILHVVETAEQYNPCAHAEWGVLHRGDAQPSHRLGAQPARQLRLLRNFCSDLPEWIRRHRHGTIVLVRCGTRRWAYRKSAITTTVHSGARSTSELETNLSLSWRKFVAESVVVCRSCKNGETRVRTKFRSVSKNGNQVATWKASEPGFSLKDKMRKFLLKSDLRSRNANFTPCVTGEESRN